MHKISLLFLFVLYVSAALPVKAVRTDSLKIELVTKDLSLEPGKMSHVVFRIGNLSSTLIKVQTEAAFPEGLRLAFPLPVLQLDPGKSGISVISFTVPEQYPAGKHSLAVSFREITWNEIIHETEVGFTIPEKENFSFELLNAPAYVMGGENITASYLLRNLGNCRQKFTLETYNCDAVTPSSLVLNPGESFTVRVTAKTSRDIPSSTVYGFSVQTSISEELKKRDFRCVRIYPLKEEKADLYFRYPVTLTSRYLARGRDGKYFHGYQLEAKGSGFLDEEKKHKLEFMARGPNNYNLSFLGLYDEYYISYTGTHFESFAGSKSYSLTPLTEMSRFGYGTEHVFVTRNGSRFGVMYVEPRFYKEIKNELAAYANLSIFKENRAGFYFLAKNSNKVPGYAFLGSFNASLKPFKSTMAELEYSLGRSDGKDDHAFRMILNINRKFFNLHANYYITGKNYPGYFRNSTFYSGNLNVNLTKSINMGISAREDFSNAALDTLLSSAPYSKTWMATFNYRINRNLSFRTYYFDYERKDRMPIKQFDYHTTSWNGEFNHNLNKFGYQLGGEYGKTFNNMTGYEAVVQQNSYRINLNISYRPSYLFSFQGFTSYSNMNSFIASDQKDWLWGVSANGQLAKNLRTTLQVQNSYAIEDYYLNRNLFQFSLDYTFLKRHKISANSYYMLYQNERGKPDFTFSVTYSVQIGVSLKKTMEDGSLAGKLVDVNGEPLKGVILLLNGKSSVTGIAGEFSFKNLIPGKYQLIVPRDKLGMDEVLNLPVPFELEIMANQVSRINLQIVKAAKITGKIKIADAEHGVTSTGQPQSELGNIVLDLKNELENIRIISNHGGDFEFPRLRPGKWILHIYKNNIDPQYNLERESYEFNLEPGENKEVSIELVQRSRKIIFKSSTVHVLPVSPEQGAKNRSKEDSGFSQVPEKEIWYSVQVASVMEPIPAGYMPFRGIDQLFEKEINGRYKYFSGRFPTARQARKYRDSLKRRIPDAFIVAFDREEPMLLKDAIKKEKQGYLVK